MDPIGGLMNGPMDGIHGWAPLMDPIGGLMNGTIGGPIDALLLTPLMAPLMALLMPYC